MDTQDLLRRWREKNTATKKAVSVDIGGVGQVFVRTITVDDRELVERLSAAGKENYKPMIMAGMLCDENGGRFPQEVIAEFEEVFKTATQGDYNKITNAAFGQGVVSPN